MAMKKFQVTFIPNCYSHKDDPSDYKEWDYFEGESKEDVLNEVRKSAMVLRCSEVPMDEN